MKLRGLLLAALLAANTAGFATTASAASVPSAPQNFALAENEDFASAQFSWDAPADNGGSDITDYWLAISTNKGKSWKSDTITGLDVEPTASQLSGFQGGLSGGQTYVFKLAAINDAGRGAYSAPITVTQPVGPPTVSMPWISPKLGPKGGVVINWIKASLEGGKNLRYDLYTSLKVPGSRTVPGSWKHLVSLGATATSFEYKNPPKAVKVFIALKATNNVGFFWAQAADNPYFTLSNTGKLTLPAATQGGR